MWKNAPNPIRFAKTFYNENEVPVIDHLAYEVKDLDEMVKQGKPISQNSLDDMYYDGEIRSRVEVPSDRRRGVDINDLWNETRRGKRQASKAGVRQVDLSNLNQS